MEDTIYVIGHKNPDVDAICSAIAYSSLKEALGQKHYVPARCGNINTRISTILEHFDVAPPTFIGDVTPRVHDIMIPSEKVFKITAKSTYAEALEIIDTHDIRALPIVDEKNRATGLISIFQLGEYFIPNPSQPKRMRIVNTSVKAIVHALDAEVINLSEESRIEELFIRVAVMDEKSFADFSQKEGTPEESIVIVGDRSDIQERAIELGIRILVITGPGWKVNRADFWL